MPRFCLSINDEEREYEATRQGDRLYLVNGDGTVDVQVTVLANGRFMLEYSDADGYRHRLQMAGHRTGDQRQLWIDERTLVARRQRRQGTPGTGSDSSLSTSIPAVVSQVLVSPGDEVAAGDKLILLESMKMVIPIQAPAAGRVIKINCAAGDSVPAGLLLVELEAL